MRFMFSGVALKTLLRLTLTGFLALAAIPAHAGSAAAGTVHTINPSSMRPVFFSHTGTRTGKPACSTLNRWAIDTSTPAGQALVAVLLTAYASGKQIAIMGTGNCNLWGDTETAEFFAVED